MATRSRVPTPTDGESTRRSRSCPTRDAQLLERIRLGDAEAMNLVVRETRIRLCRFVRRRTGTWEAAEDVVQETFLRFWAHRATWRAKAPIIAILAGVARYVAADAAKARNARRSVAESWPKPPDVVPPDEVYERLELQEAVRSAVRKLPERRRRVVELVCFEGRSYQEAADILSISPQTVANQLTKARRQLRTALKAYADTTPADVEALSR